MLWEIENVDAAGEGVFFVDAPSPEKALEIYRQHEKAEVTSITKIEWSSLAAVTGELGETYYFERQRKVIP